MSASPLLSIVIPTRNRMQYAISAIRSILEIADPRLELVVQDNSESPEVRSFVQASIRDDRLRYRYSPDRVSIIDNFNAALELANGEYLCLIGDDDGVNPEIVDAAAWAKSQQLDSLAVLTRINYLWESTGVASTFFTEVVGSSLTVAPFAGSVRQSDPEVELRKLMRNGGLYYLDYDLPKLYHGLVHRRCMNAVRERTGAFFGGLSPDIFASLAVACISKRVAVTDYPLTIPGACKTSGSVIEGGTRQHSKKLEDAHHFQARGDYAWSELVPRVYTAETIWADSGLAAVRAMGREDLVSEFSVEKVGAFCIAANRGVTSMVIRDVFRAAKSRGHSPPITAIRFLAAFVSGPGFRFSRRVWNRVLLMIGLRAMRRIDGIEDMVQASHALTRLLRSSGLAFLPLTATNADLT